MHFILKQIVSPILDFVLFLCLVLGQLNVMNNYSKNAGYVIFGIVVFIAINEYLFPSIFYNFIPKKFLAFFAVIELLFLYFGYYEEPHCILPHDLRGRIYIVYNQKTGTSPIYTSSSFFTKERIYHIPKSGVLFTQSDTTSGVIIPKK